MCHLENFKIKIISGGQTGADMAGIDFAIANSDRFDFGGTVPQGWRQIDSEGNTISNASYFKKFPGKFIENDEFGYANRTKKNVEDSDITLIFATNPDSSGTKLTLNHALKKGKKVIVADPRDEGSVETMKDRFKEFFTSFLNVKGITVVVNIAGNSERSSPGIYKISISSIQRIFADF